MKPALLSILLAFAMLGCSRQEQSLAQAKPAEETAVKAYFDHVLRNEPVPYRIGGVSGYVVRNYELMSAGNGLAVVRLTVASRAGTDLVQTKRYAIESDGRLRPLESEDIDESVRENLATMLWLTSQERGFGAKLKDGKIAFRDLSPDAQHALTNLHSHAGEDYRNAELVTGGGVFPFSEISVTLSNGRVVRLTSDEARKLGMN